MSSSENPEFAALRELEDTIKHVCDELAAWRRRALKAEGFSTYLEVRYHHVPGDGGAFKFVPITVGMRF